MNLWDQNVINDFLHCEPMQSETSIFSTPHRLLAIQVLNEGTDASHILVECEKTGGGYLGIHLFADANRNSELTFFNFSCDNLYYSDAGSGGFSFVNVFYTTPASGTLMISDATHTAFIENKMDLGDVFIIGFLTIFFTIFIFKWIWNFVFPKITKAKTINDL